MAVALTRKELPRTGTFFVPWGYTMTTSGAIIKAAEAATERKETP